MTYFPSRIVYSVLRQSHDEILAAFKGTPEVLEAAEEVMKELTGFDGKFAIKKVTKASLPSSKPNIPKSGKPIEWISMEDGVYEYTTDICLSDGYNPVREISTGIVSIAGNDEGGRELSKADAKILKLHNVSYSMTF